jgi:hypothetical protein
LLGLEVFRLLKVFVCSVKSLLLDDLGLSVRHLRLLLCPWDLRYVRYNTRQLGTCRNDGEGTTTWHDWESWGKQGHDREVEEVLVTQNLCRDDSSQVLVGAFGAES